MELVLQIKVMFVFEGPNTTHQDFYILRGYIGHVVVEN
jgi:hypothetical protein